MSGENCLIFNWNVCRAAPGISFSRVPTKDDKTLETALLQLLIDEVEGNLKRQIENRTFSVALSSS